MATKRASEDENESPTKRMRELVDLFDYQRDSWGKEKAELQRQMEESSSLQYVETVEADSKTPSGASTSSERLPAWFVQEKGRYGWEITNLKKENAALQTKLLVKQNELDIARDDWNSEVRHNKTRISHLREDNVRLRMKYPAKAKVVVIENENRDLKKVVGDLTTEVAELESSNLELGRVRMGKQKELLEEAGKVRGLVKEKNDITRKVAELEEQNAALTTQVSSLNDTKRQLTVEQGKARDLQEDKIRLAAKVEELERKYETEVDYLKERNNKLELDAGLKKAELEKKDQELMAARDKCRKIEQIMRGGE